MTTKWPSSCIGAVSSISKHQNRHHGACQIAILYHTSFVHRATKPILVQPRRYASSQTSSSQKKDDLTLHEKSALVEIQGLRKSDPINPPRSTVPPPLNLPNRAEAANVFHYYYSIGRTYGTFYWRGIKAVWFNHRAVKLLKSRIAKEAAEIQDFKQVVGVQKILEILRRSEFQLLERNNHDIGKLPFFGLLVALFGEWLPLLVPFIPSAVPGTCRIPKQVEGMRGKGEERRRRAFRQGISEPTSEQIPDADGAVPAEVAELARVAWPMAQREYARYVLGRLRDDQLLHLSSSLNLHNRAWDLIQLPPPSFLLRRGISRHLAYLATDDALLLKYGGAKKLAFDEVLIACEERGLDVLGKREQVLYDELSWWLARQEEDKGKGKVMMTMLFRRPNAWGTSASAKSAQKLRS